MKRSQLSFYTAASLASIFTILLLSTEICSSDKPAAQAKAAKYEEPKVTPVNELLPAELIKGKYYTIAPNVPTDGFENRYFLTSPFGSFRAYGDGMLATRIDEINTIAEKRSRRVPSLATHLKRPRFHP